MRWIYCGREVYRCIERRIAATICRNSKDDGWVFNCAKLDMNIELLSDDLTEAKKRSRGIDVSQCSCCLILT